VRHGQVALHGAGYGGLSELGEQQADEVGLALRQRGVLPSRVAAGNMQRHHQTAERARLAAGWSAPIEIDVGWDEFDHVAVMASAGHQRASDRSLSGADTLRRFFGVAIPRWSSGQHDEDYAETFGEFTERVTDTFQRLVTSLDDRETAVVFTSAGVIGRVAATLLNATEKEWLTLIPVAVNCGVTRVRVTGEDAFLVSYNEHGHLHQAGVTQR
jgi:broad specificity phosphatase PhoE